MMMQSQRAFCRWAGALTILTTLCFSAPLQAQEAAEGKEEQTRQVSQSGKPAPEKPLAPQGGIGAGSEGDAPLPETRGPQAVAYPLGGSRVALQGREVLPPFVKEH